MLPISVCMIAKNEEHFIGECLLKLSYFDWEIIVVDTGSTDLTKEIAKQYTSNVYEYTWDNDFSAARNYCISKASYSWILNIDCDEYLNIEYTQKELEILLAPYYSLYRAAGTVEILNPHTPSSNSHYSIERVARFFHKGHYQYEGTVHEQPASINNLLISYFDTPLSFYHIGYSNSQTLERKAKRNIALLEKELCTKNNDPYLYYQLGQSYYVMGDKEKACNYFSSGLSFDLDLGLQYVKNMVESYGYCLLHLKQYEQALTFENIYNEFCSHADFVFLMGLIYMNNALFYKAIAEFNKATTIADYSSEGINSYLAFYNIGVIYECMGNLLEAKINYEKCGEYLPAKDALLRISK